MKVVLFSVLVLLGLENVNSKSQPERIGGGRPVTKGQYPFFAQLRLLLPKQNLQGYICGASMINGRWLISAAHCFYNFKDDLHLVKRYVTVYLGTIKRFGKDGVENTISNVYMHPQYFEKTDKEDTLEIRNDIALLNLTKEYVLNNYINVIRLPSPTQNPNKWMEQCSPGIVLGVGLLDDNPEKYHDKVLYGKEHPIPRENLTVRLGPNLVQPNTTFFSETPWLSAHTMQGDSGGPFLCFHNRNPVLYGITSIGQKVLQNRRYISLGIYERVDQHLDFIQEHVGYKYRM